MQRLAAFVIALALGGGAIGPSAAACEGRDLLAEMPAERRAQLQAATDAVPFPRGNFWRATRTTAAGAEEITLVGTYHLDDPRHAPVLAALTPTLDAATTILVEAAPDEQKALQDHIARDPSIMLITEGPSLLEQMSASDWRLLTDALDDRGVPSMMAARMQPWYVNLMLAIPTCAVEGLAENKGLDGLIMAHAEQAGIPLVSLERYDTVLALFDLMPAADQIGMIRTTLALESRAQDFSVTLANAYFAGESRMMWELMRQESYGLPGFTPEQVDAELGRMEEILMVARNKAWIPVIKAAAARGPVVAAFGALHLPGQDGVLALLQREGFQLTELAF